MPIVTIHATPPSDEHRIAKLISDIQVSGAKALSCDASNIWVTFQPVVLEHHTSDYPPMVYVKANKGRTHEVKSLFVSVITEVLAGALSLTPDKIWVHYQEIDPTDIWFEGHWSA